MSTKASRYFSQALVSLLMLQGSALSAQEQKQPGSNEGASQPAQTSSAPTNTAPSEESTSTAKFSQGVGADGKPIERIEVTGSRIKRVQSEGPSPVKVMQKEEIERTGTSSVSDLLRNVTASNFGAPREQSGSNAAGVASVDLRGLGADKTLVLLNGRRLPTDAVTGAVDLNLIPMEAIERVEVLKDGASALYGSDALGGVVNLITKKNYSGSHVNYMQSVTSQKGGEQKALNLVVGTSDKDSSLLGVVSYRKTEPIWARDRHYSKDGVSKSGSPGRYRTFDVVDKDNDGQPDRDEADGSLIKENMSTWKADPNCPTDSIVTGKDGSHCLYDYAKVASIFPEIEQLASLVSYNKKVNNKLDFFFLMNSSRRLLSWEFAPAPDTFELEPKVAAKLGLPDDASKGMEVTYRTVELGNRRSEVETTSFGGTAGFKGQITDSWDWEIAMTENRVSSMDVGVKGYALTSLIKDEINDGQFNPMAAPGSRGSLQPALYEPWEKTLSKIKTFDVKTSGDLFAMAGGEAGLAIGGSVTREEFVDRMDNMSVQGLVHGNAGSTGGGARSINSAYAELGLPVLSSLELQVAARHDSFSDFGSTTNPKFAVRYQPLPSLLLRSSVGTGFKAPKLQDLYAATGDGYQTFVDRVACEDERATTPGSTPSCNAAQYHVTSGGNTGLKEEKAKFFNFGIVSQPWSFLDFGVDYWVTKINNIVSVDYEGITEAERRGIDVASKGISITRNNGVLETMVAPLQNLASQDVSGVDTTLGLNGNLGPQKFGYNLDYSYVVYFKEETFPGIGTRNRIGEKDHPQWRMNNSVLYGIGANNASIIASTIAGQKKEDKTAGKIPVYTTYDGQYTYTGSWNGAITLGVKNIFDKNPPEDDTSSEKVSGEIYDVKGRSYYMKVSQNF